MSLKSALTKIVSPYLKNKTQKKVEHKPQVVKQWPIKCKALKSIPSIEKEKKKEREKEIIKIVAKVNEI
jgi:predicted metal-dependent RNase